MTIIAVVVYIIGWLAFFYAIIPSIVEGPIGAWIYRACVLHPGSWVLGIPFVGAAFVMAFVWPAVLLLWLLSGRRRPPLIATQALFDCYGEPYRGEGPVLSRVPHDIPKRLQRHPTKLQTKFDSNASFWKFYNDRTSS